MTAQILGNRVRISLSTCRGDMQTFEVPLVSPSRVDRSTGTLRSPAAAKELSIDTVSGIVAAVTGGDGAVEVYAGWVIGVLVHVVSRRATAIGAFLTSGQASEWWAQPFNRLAHHPDMVFHLVPVTQDACLTPN